MAPRKGGRRRGYSAAPAPPAFPKFFVEDAEVLARYAEMTGAADAAELRATADGIADWASVNGVELNPDDFTPRDPGYAYCPWAVVDECVVAWGRV